MHFVNASLTLQGNAMENSPQSGKSKISHGQQRLKPSYRQLLGYNKELKMFELYPSPVKKALLINLMRTLK